MTIKDKKVTVVGLARSGAGAARLLSLLGAEVTVTDKRSEGELIDMIKGLRPSVRLALGGHPEEVFTKADLIVVSPGVPLEIWPIAAARAKGIQVIGELELAYRIMQGLGVSDLGLVKDAALIPNPQSPIPFLAITGSNGKSTTTTLLDYMMKKAGFNTVFGGNIGNALTEEIYKIVTSNELRVTGKGEDLSPITHHPSPDFFVVEVSSFQLEAIDGFRPHIASLLNITPDHLDRYYSMDEYRNAKANIYRNQQSGDFLVLNADDPETMRLYDSRFKIQDSRLPEVYFFSREKEVNGIYYKDGIIYSNFINPQLSTYNSQLINADEIRIKGVHNLENAMAASAMALLAHCPLEAVIQGMKEFEGLEHRLEPVRELDGVTYINDSKGTNVGAVVKSIESFREPVVLIAGGRDKAGDFSVLREPVSQKVKAILLIGEASCKIQDALGDVTETHMAKDLAEAVTMSRRMAKKGDVVLLSPACASFDMFRDYEDRGRQFKKIVMELKNNNA
ncbi:MAG: UDP-N-acetylmuramoyl-L-alanine--D-glutamate ligase [Nitrospira bacterium HGW-Nitrospira-1]|nr:MAG: UDP-N-acetylmuramoyl-L-alanine--D-glutamate ligase [Nitrospira bacterium HGW-Nitrospira-1]